MHAKSAILVTLHNICELCGEDFQAEWNAEDPFAHAPHRTPPTVIHVHPSAVEVRDALVSYCNVVL